MTFQNQRLAYGNALVELGHKRNDIVVLEADLGKSTMSILFKNEFSDRYFEMGIGESNMASFAAGLAVSGKTPFINSFAVFTTGRCYDQIRQSICTANLNVKIGGSSAGLSDFGDGATHQAIEDIAIMRALPNMTVLVPADCIEAVHAVRLAAEIDGPVYIRISRSDVPNVSEEPSVLDFKPVVLREGTDVCLFACGVMVDKALTAAEQLAEERVSAKVINIRCLKPLDEESVRALTCGIRTVVTCEEHSIIGGLGAAIAVALAKEDKKIGFVAIQDEFGQSAHNVDDLMEHYGLTPSHIKSKVKEIL